MVDKYIEQAPGGELTSPTGEEQLPATNGTTDWYIRIKNLVARKLRETGGPTVLDLGAIADGKVVKRSGSNLVGGETTTIQESSGPTILSIGAIADGKVVKRSGSNLVGGETTTIQESSGPTILSVGAIADGKVVKRSGSSLVSGETTTIQESGGPTVLSIGTISDGEYLKRSGNTIISGVGGGSASADGWNLASESWTRTGNHTFTVSGDVRATYRKGAKVRYKDGGAYEYGVIHSSSYSAPNTTVTLFTNADYAMAATTITDRYISYIENPEGFPASFNYTPSTAAITLGNGTLTAKFSVLHGQVFGSYNLVFGSTSSFTGNIAIGFPCAANDDPYFVPGNVSLVNTGTALYTGVCLADTSIRAMNAGGTYAVYTYVTSTAPFTWASADEIVGSFRFHF